MKRRILITLLVGIFLVGIVTSGIILSNNNTMEMNKDWKGELDKRGVENPITIHVADNDKMWSCLKHPTDENFNMPCSKDFDSFYMNCTSYDPDYPEDMPVCLSEERVNYTIQEKEDILNKWDEDKMNQLGKVWHDRSLTSDKIIISEGVLTTENKK